jgi:hypothetical protein
VQFFFLQFRVIVIKININSGNLKEIKKRISKTTKSKLGMSIRETESDRAMGITRDRKLVIYFSLILSTFMIDLIASF